MSEPLPGTKAKVIALRRPKPSPAQVRSAKAVGKAVAYNVMARFAQIFREELQAAGFIGPEASAEMASAANDAGAANEGRWTR